jgi:hypothetical protein
MTFTEKDLAAQTAQLDQLKDELARLDGLYAQQLAALGLSEEDLGRLDLDNQPPELKKLLDEARKAARQAGEQRAQEAKAQTASSVGPSRRRDVVRL